MRNVKVAVGLLVLALAGCTSGSPAGSSSGSASAPGSTAGSTAGSTTLSSSVPASVPSSQTAPASPPQVSAEPLPGGPTEVPAPRVDGSTLSDLHKRQAWASSDGRTVQVVGLGGGCKTASAEVTAQSADQVLITLVTTYYPPAGGVCAQELRDVPLNVALDAPLGDRRLVLEAREQTG